MFDFLFDFFAAWNVVGLLLGGLVFCGIGGLFLADFLIWRIKGRRVEGTIVGVRASGVRSGIDDKSDESATGDDVAHSESGPQKPLGVGGRILFALFALIPLLFVGIGGFFLYDFLNLRATGQSVQGQVVGYEESYDSESGTSYYPVVTFFDTQGTRRELRGNMGGNSQKFEIGETVPVVFEVRDPEHFYIDDFWPNVLFPSAFVAMGSLFLVVFYLGATGKVRSGAPRPPAARRKTARGSGYGQEMYRSIIAYRNARGETVEADTGSSSSSLAGRVPGSRVPVWVRDDKPDEIRGRGTGIFFLGAVFAVPGVVLFWIAFTQFEFTPAVFLLLGALAAFAGLKIRKIVKPRALWDSKESFAARMKEKRKARRESGVLLDRAQVLRRLRQQDRVTVRWIPLFLLIGVGLMGGGWYLGEKQAFLEGNGVRAPGTVVELESVYSSSSDGGGYTYYPVVRFNTREGESVRFRSGSGSNPPMYSTGEAVTVLYDPNAPRRSAMIDAGWMNWILPGAVGFAGIVVLFMTLRTWTGIRRRGRSAL
ncbi:MAG: DUF3592 domain-containing protein [Alphaproteobacteria bacterium]|nr:DUF3592 domain-containing protein [Alphaproteobacteria bacterium]